MAYGDVKYQRQRSRSDGINWEAREREESKDMFEEFERDFQASGYNPNFKAWLDRGTLLKFATDAVLRYGKHDYKNRTKELVISKTGQTGWEKLETYRKELEQERRDEVDAHNKVVEKRRAERIETYEEEISALHKEAELTAGSLQSDFQSAFKLKERTSQPEGDWLDDVVDAYVSGYGWGEEVKERAGIKLQITLSLDLSNSMWHNGIAKDAGIAFVNLWLALKELKSEFPDSLFIKPFAFSKGEEGKYAFSLDETKGIGEVNNVYSAISPNSNNYYQTSDLFSGEDTWITPLFRQIESWENADETDPGAVRLDLIISDAVLEHKTDIRDASVIQERRDGNLQTIILNLMPEEKWHNSALPKRCYQYPTNVENLRGLLRTILSEFVSVYA